MKTYYQYENDSLINPKTVADALDLFKKINPPQICKEKHQNIIDEFSVQPIDETLA
jgi:hypothetical protein